MSLEHHSHEPHIAVAHHWIQHTGMTDDQRALLPAKQEGDRAALSVMEGYLVGRGLVRRRGDDDCQHRAPYLHPCSREGGFALDAYPAVGAWLDRVAVEPGHVPMDLSGSSLGRTGLKEAAAGVRRRKEG